MGNFSNSESSDVIDGERNIREEEEELIQPRRMAGFSDYPHGFQHQNPADLYAGGSFGYHDFHSRAPLPPDYGAFGDSDLLNQEGFGSRRNLHLNFGPPQQSYAASPDSPDGT